MGSCFILDAWAHVRARRVLASTRCFGDTTTIFNHVHQRSCLRSLSPLPSGLNLWCGVRISTATCESRTHDIFNMDARKLRSEARFATTWMNQISFFKRLSSPLSVFGSEENDECFVGGDRRLSHAVSNLFAKQKRSSQGRFFSSG